MSKNEAKRLLIESLTIADATLIEFLGFDFWTWLDWAAVQVILCHTAITQEG